MGLRGRNAQPLKRATSDAQNSRRGPFPGKTRADKVIKWIERLKITSGIHAGRSFKLRPWQKKIIRGIYATDKSGKRTVRQALISVPRKNGKTQLAAALALCHLCGPEAKPRGQVYSAAADRAQAALIFREMRALIEADAELAGRVIVRNHYKDLEDIETGSIYQALSSDARKAHGLSPTFVVCDEVAQWHGRELYENLVTGCGAHAEPLLVVISTMSPDPASLISELVRYGEQCRDGMIKDDHFLPIIYAAPATADPWSEDTWHACNPALGDFRSLEEMRVAADQAQRLPAREASFRLLYLNQPIDAASRFLNRADWDACKNGSQKEPISGPCMIGLDLSATTDLTALVAFFPDSGDLRAWFWMPADTLAEAERRDRVPYLTWARTGFLETTPGRAIDKAFIVHRLGEIAEDFKVEAVAYDRWGMAEFQRLMADEGLRLNMVEFGQGWKDMAPALSAMEKLVLNRELRHPGHPILDWCVANAVALSDPAGNRKLAKDRSIGRIDGLVAAVMAVGLAARTARKKPSVYQSRGLLTLEL